MYLSISVLQGLKMLTQFHILFYNKKQKQYINAQIYSCRKLTTQVTVLKMMHQKYNPLVLHVYCIMCGRR